MTSLDIARQGKAAARQLRAQARAGVLSKSEFSRLLDKIEAGFEQMMPSEEPTQPLPAGVRRGFAPIVHDGGRS